MGACNDCGAAVSSIKEIADHYAEEHAGSPRFRFWDGSKETVLCADCGTDVTPIVARTEDTTPKMEWDYTVHVQQERAKAAHGLSSHHGGEL